MRSPFVNGIDVRIVPIDILGHDRARYDRHSQRLLISEKLDAEQRLWEVALLVAQLEGRAKIDEIISASQFAKQAEKVRLLRQELAHELALAILCPPAKFASSAVDLKFDVEALALRFNVNRSRVLRRIAISQGFGFLAVDLTGAVIEKREPLRFQPSP